MARTLKGNGGRKGQRAGSNAAPEAPYFDRLAELYRAMANLRQDEKEVCIEARQADVRIQPLKRAVKLYLESEEERTARLEKEEEAERILRALGLLADTPLGQAAVDLATVRRARHASSRQFDDRDNDFEDDPPEPP